MTKSLAFLFLAGLAQSLSAASISVTSSITAETSGGSLFHGAAGTQVRMLTNSGAVLPAGSQVRVGFFLNYTPSLDQALKSGDLAAILTGPNRFIPFGESTSPTGYGTDSTATNDIKDIGGTLRASVTIPSVNYIGADGDISGANTLASGGVARGTKVFMFLYNSSSLDTSAAGFEFGLYSASNWVIPSSGTANTSITLQHVDTAAEVYWGRLGSLHTAAPVPEPGVSLLALASLGLLARRRR